MKITLSNKRLTQKIKLSKKFSEYFGSKGKPNRIIFKTANIRISDLENIIGSGYTLGYQCVNDDNMERKNGFIGTDFIAIDVDATDNDLETMLSLCIYKPTVIHTTFSNLTINKDNKYCYHLIYCLDGTITGEDTFNLLFEYFATGYRKIVDEQAKDCHRLIFTSDSSLPNYKYVCTNTIYKLSELPLEEKYDNLDTLFEDDKSSVSKCKDASLPSSSYNKEANAENETIIENDLELDSTFLNDINTLSRHKFITKYNSVYPYITSTLPTEDLIVDMDGFSFADFSNTEYYEIPSRYRHTSDGYRIKRVPIGKRNKNLIRDAYVFCKCNPDITKELLLFSLIRDVYQNYDNSDKELSNHKLIDIVKSIWKTRNNAIVSPTPKKCKFIRFTNYVDELTKRKAITLMMRYLKENDIGSLLDLSISLEDNIEILKKSGKRISKQWLKKFCQEYDCQILTRKEMRNEFVINSYVEDPSRSSRDIVALCKEKGYSIGKDTVIRILDSYKND